MKTINIMTNKIEFIASNIDIFDKMTDITRISFKDIEIPLSDIEHWVGNRNIRFYLDKSFHELATNYGEEIGSNTFSTRKLVDWCEESSHRKYMKIAAENLDYSGKLPPKISASEFVDEDESLDIIKISMGLFFGDAIISNLHKVTRYLAYRYLLNKGIETISSSENTEMCKALKALNYNDKLKHMIKIIDSIFSRTHKKELVKSSVEIEADAKSCKISGVNFSQEYYDKNYKALDNNPYLQMSIKEFKKEAKENTAKTKKGLISLAKKLAKTSFFKCASQDKECKSFTNLLLEEVIPWDFSASTNKYNAWAVSNNKKTAENNDIANCLVALSTISEIFFEGTRIYKECL